MKKNFERIIGIFLSIYFCLNIFRSIPILATEEQYLYTIFASNNNEDSIFLNALNITTNGKLCTNGTIHADATNCHLNESIIENANIDMIYINNKLCSTYFSLENPEVVDSYIKTGKHFPVGKHDKQEVPLGTLKSISQNSHFPLSIILM